MKRQNLKINDPCTENWDEMHENDGAARFCDKCTKNVHNLSDMTREEASEFLAAHSNSNLCVIYKYDAKTNDVLFREAGPSTLQLAGLKKLVAAAAMVPLLAGCDTSQDYEPCSIQQDEVRPIDLIREQESRFMDFFDDLFGDDEPLLMGEIAPVEVTHEPSIEVDPVEPPVKPTVDHELREEVDNQTDPPMRRLMGKVAPTRYVPTEIRSEKPEQPEVREIMGDMALEY